MRSMSKAAGLAAGMVAAVSVASFAQQGGAGRGPRPTASPETLVVLGNMDWMEKSDVTALREGVIEQIEFRVGDRVEAGKPIGNLHQKMAELAVAKAKVAAEGYGAVKKAQAQIEVARQKVVRLKRLQIDKRANVTQEEMLNAEAELSMALASEEEARDNQDLAKAELDLNKQTLAEHTIYAPPFTGYVITRNKNPNESVRASESVALIGRMDKLRFHGFVPLESAGRVAIGDRVEVRAVVDESDLPLEQRKFTGKITAITPEVQTVGRTEVQVLADVDNAFQDEDRPGSGLIPGMKAEMTILLGTAGAPAGAVTQRAAAPAR